jgi:hypothetical protein
LLTILCSETQIQTQKFSNQNNLAKLRIIFTKYKLFNNNLTQPHTIIIIYNHLQNCKKPLPVALEGPKNSEKPTNIYKNHSIIVSSSFFGPIILCKHPLRPDHPTPAPTASAT